MDRIFAAIAALIAIGGVAPQIVDDDQLKSHVAAEAIYSSYSANKPLVQADAKPTIGEAPVSIASPAGASTTASAKTQASKQAVQPLKQPATQPLAVPTGIVFRQRITCGPNGCSPATTYYRNTYQGTTYRRGIFGRWRR